MKSSPSCKRHLIAAALIAGTLAALPAAVHAQDAATSPAITRVESDTRIEKIADLHFGDIIPGSGGGTITLDVNGNVSTTGTVVSMGGNPQVAEFEITRRIFADFPVYNGPLGTDSVELQHISLPGESMTLRNFTTDFNRTGFFGLPAYLFRTRYDFRIAGTLDVGPDQEPGSYLGYFTVTIDYNCSSGVEFAPRRA